jgi:tetratricopeptide (TPR) repeat protein
MPPQEQAQHHLNKAKRLTTRRNFNAAFREFEAAIRLHYNNSQAYVDFGYALIRAGRYPEALEKLKKAAEFNPATEFNIGILAKAFDHNIRQQQDLDEFQKIVDKAQSDDLMHTWAQVLTELKRHQSAFDEFKKALTKNPELNLNTSSLATTLENSGATEQQVEAFQKIVDELKNAKAWNIWGVTLLKLRRHTAAAEQFKTAADAKRDWAEPYRNLGRTFIELADYPAAINALKKALSYGEPSIEIYLGLGEAFYQNEKYDEAVSNYKTATATSPSEQYFVPWLEAIKKLPKPDSAIPDYLQALQKSDQTRLLASAYAHLGEFLNQLGRLPESAVQFARAAALDGTNESQTKLQEAISDLEEPADTLEIIESIFDKSDSDGYAEWSVVLAKSNQVDRVIQQLPRIIRDLRVRHFGPDNVLRNLALAFKSAPNGNVALARIEEELSKTRNGSAQVEWARLHEADLNEREQSLNLYKKLLLNNPRASRLVERLTEAIRSSSNQQAVITDIRATVNDIEGNHIATAEVCYHWALILIELNEPKAAIQELERAVTLDQNHSNAHFILGQQYNAEGNYIKARQQLLKSLELIPDRSAAVRELGTALLNCGQKEEALEKYLEMVRMVADHVHSSNLLAICKSLTWDDAVVDRFQKVFDEINKPASYREWGTFLVNIKQPKRAIEQFKKSIELDPDSWTSFSEWLTALGACGLSGELIDEYEQCIVKYQKDADAYFNLGEFLYRLKRMDESLQSYQQALELDPKHDRARAGAMYCLVELNDIPAARAQAQQLLADDPSNGLAHDCLSWSDLLDGKYQEAVKRCELGIKQGHFYLYDACARALYKLGEEEKALQKYDEAFKGNPDDFDILFAKVILLMEMNRYQEALSILETIVKARPEHPYANHNLAAIPHDRGRYEEAWGKWMHATKVYKQQGSLLTRAIEGKNADSNEVYNHAAIVFYVLHKPDEAEKILKEGRDFNPNNTLILSLLANVYWENKDELTELDAESIRRKIEFHKQGMECFQKAERLLQDRSKRYPNYSILVELGDLYLLHEDYEKARLCFEQARDTDSTAYLPYAKLGVIYLRERQPDKAIPLLCEAQERNPDDLDIKSSLAEAYLRAEKLNEAETAYRQVLNLAPNHVQSSIGLGELYSILGDKDPDRYSEAIDLFSKALELADNEKARSKYLKKTEKAAVYYQIGYARVQCYESSGIRRDTTLLKQAEKDFDQCIALNPSHQKARRAKEKIERRWVYFKRDRLTETVGPRSIYRMSIAVFVAVQIAFFLAPLFNQPSFRVSDRSVKAVENDLTAKQLEGLKALENKSFSREMLSKTLQPLPGDVVDTILQNADISKPIENAPDLPVGYYALLTFGSLLFMVVGLYLPQILKLKVAGIELEKSSIDQAAVGDQAFAGGTLGVSKP